jgi:FtsH-binding integral membrane protein
MRPRPLNIARMNVPRLLNLLRQDWWLLALVVCIVWTIEGVIEGNTFVELLIGPVMVVLWAGAIVLIDRWALRASDRAKSKGTIGDCADRR